MAPLRQHMSEHAPFSDTPVIEWSGDGDETPDVAVDIHTDVFTGTKGAGHVTRERVPVSRS